MRVKRSWLISLRRLNLAWLIFLIGCASPPLVIQIPTTATPVRPKLDPTSAYREVLDAIVWAMWTDLELPPTDGVVTFYPNRFALETALVRHLEQEFEEADQQGPLLLEAVRAKFWSLIEQKIEQQPEEVKQAVRAKAAAEFEQRIEKEFERAKQTARANKNEEITFVARQRAATVVAVTGHGRVIVNELILVKYSSSDRIKTLAHELAHLVHQALTAGRTRSMSLPERAAESVEKGFSSNTVRPGLWLMEGFAEWVGYKVLNTLDVQPFGKSHEYALDQIEKARRYQTFPALAQLVAVQDWQTWTASLGLPATYGQAFLAMESLVDQKGLAAVTEYFRLFGDSNDRERNFTAAFGEPASAFEEKFDSYLSRLLGK